MSGKPSAASAANEERFDPKRTLVVFFSRRGENYAPGGTEVLAVDHTEFLTRRTAERFGMDLFEVRTVDPYPEKGSAVTGVDAESWAPEVEAWAGRFICLEAQ